MGGGIGGGVGDVLGDVGGGKSNCKYVFILLWTSEVSALKYIQVTSNRELLALYLL